MLGAIGSTNGTGDTSTKAVAVKNNDQAGALNAQIRSDQAQLNDWVTCVSAKTTKGQAEIQSLSARISGAKQRIARLNAEQGTAGATVARRLNNQASASATADAIKPPAAVVSTQATARHGVLIDTWA
jgi:hypothetical protein